MNCEEFIRQLDLLMDDALDEAQRRELNEHAHACPDCAAELRAALQLKAMLKSLPVEADVPLAAQAGWRRAVRAESKRMGTRRLTRMAAAAAAVMVALVGVRLAAPMANKATSPAPAKSTSYEAEERATDGSAKEEKAVYAASENAAEADVYYAAEESIPEEAVYAAGESAASNAYDGGIPLFGSLSLAADSAEEDAEAGGVAELYSVAICVEDVQAAGEGILDAAREYDADAALTETESGAQVEATLSAADARELLEAVRQWDAEPDAVALPEVSGEEEVALLVHIQAK